MESILKPIISAMLQVLASPDQAIVAIGAAAAAFVAMRAIRSLFIR